MTDQASTGNRGEGCPGKVREVEIIYILTSFFFMIVIFTSLAVQGHPSPWFHVEAWLPFRNCEMDYSTMFSKYAPYALDFLYFFKYCLHNLLLKEKQ